MPSSENDARMRRLGLWMAEQFGKVPFFAGVHPSDGGPPISISSLNALGQVQLLQGFVKSFQTGDARIWIDKEPAALAGSFDVRTSDVEFVTSFLRVMLASWPATPRREAFARVVRWLDAWIAAASAPTVPPEGPEGG